MSQERTDNLFASESWTAVYTAFTNISLKAYDFDTIREALLAYTVQTYPDKFNDFIASSEFIAILDLVAYLGHSLAFRLDMNTRENFMDTAERRASILQMAKTLGYNKTRPINAKGFMKITSITTDENVFDNEGVTLAGKSIIWNDSNNIDWYENFISILNSSFAGTTKIQNPSSTLTIADVEHSLYEINEDSATKSINYSFSSNINGKSRTFEAVRVSLDTNNTKINESEPNPSNNFTIVNRNDNLGSSSDRTGFFVFAVAGSLEYKDSSYINKISNRIEQINETNISNSDVWVQKIDSSRTYVSSVTAIDNDTRETAIYNSLRNGSGDIVSINSLDNNGIELHYPDGVFGNAAIGNYRIWYRKVDNDNFSVNSNDIINKIITIPYIGTDGRTYRLTLTMSSTIDFGENFSGETYSSVRRIAPRSYYSQDRMVNAQDYNVYPLSLGNNVITKLKSVNTSFAGNSRFYEMDDVLGHHSNLSVSGTDGSLFIEDDTISTPISYNKLQGNSDNFIRNEMTKALKHPSLLNKYFYENKLLSPASAGAFVIGTVYTILTVGTTDFTLIGAANNNIGTIFTATGVGTGSGTATYNSNNAIIEQSAGYEIDEKDGMKIKTDAAPTSGVFVGDHVELFTTASEKTIWADVKKVETTTNADDTLTLNKFIPEVGTLKKVVRGFRTKFTATEITAIKDVVNSDSEESFTLRYIYSTAKPTEWEWKVYTTTPAVTDVYVDFDYSSGIRDNESEYVAKFTGKKVAFESRDQVKFFYGNTTDIIDNETNLSKRDKILLSYLSTDVDNVEHKSVDDEEIAIGQVPITNPVKYPDPSTGIGAKFDAIYEHTGARSSLEFCDSDIIDGAPTYTHHLISSDGIELPQTAFNRTNVLNPTGNTHDIIGFPDTSDTSYPKKDTIELKIDDLATLTTALISSTINDADTNPVTMGSSTAESLSSSHVGFLDGGNVNTAAYTIKSTQQLDILGFKGDPSTSYFDSGKFTWRDLDEDGSQYDTTTAGAAITYNSTTTEYTFTLSPDDSQEINIDDTGTGGSQNDVYFKQVPYGEIIINTSESLTTNNLLLKNATTGNWISDNTNIQLIDETASVSGQWRIIFWTEEVIPTTTLIGVYVSSSPSISDLATFSVRVKATFDITSGTATVNNAYKNITSYVYDDYLTKAGYIDNTKVKLLTSNIDDDPFAIFTTISDESIVLESYVNNNITYERVSKNLIAASNAILVPITGEVYYNTTESDDTWYIRGSSSWNKLLATSGNFVIGTKYEISDAPGTTDFTLIGAADSVAGTVFTATGVGTGTGTAIHRGKEITYYSVKYRVVEGMSSAEDPYSNFRWDHYADLDKRIDPSTSNIIDMYVLSADYVRKVNEWIANDFIPTTPPTAPNNFELAKIMNSIEPKGAMADHIAYIPVQFKYLFGSYAKVENQAIFKVIKRLGVGYTDSEIKTAVSTKVNEYFAINNWDFGATFYFSELAAFLHKELGDYISSIVITPKYSGNKFEDLLSISCALNEIFMAVTTSNDVKIITQLAQSELLGE